MLSLFFMQMHRHLDPAGMEPYHAIPPLSSLTEALTTEQWQPDPEEWSVALTDVMNSTEAIEAGKYRDVNVAGAVAIMALGRVFGSLSAPFVFGGDGMTFLVPRSRIDDVREALSRVVRDARQVMGLEMRAAIIPLSSIVKDGAHLGVSRLRVSKLYSQAVFHGTALSVADDMLKSLYGTGTHMAWFIAAADHNDPGDYEGFTCRWQDIPSPNGATIAMVLRPREGQRMEELLPRVEEILRGRANYHPLSVAGLKPGGKSSNFRLAARLGAGGRLLCRFFLSLRERIAIAVIKLSLKFGLRLRHGPYELDRIREQDMESADFEKFDGTLKMVFSASPVEIDALEKQLDEWHGEGRVYYGIHRAKAAHMTCIAHLPSGDDIHFVDATDGGYAMAAKAMKQQMRAAGFQGFGA